MAQLQQISVILIVCFVSTTLSEPSTMSSIGQDGAINNKVDNPFQNMFPSTTLDSNSIQKIFHINQNSIIRTHDSRLLGAIFINSTLLNTNEECMRFCWGTFNCNLAVFEGKVRMAMFLIFENLP